MKPRLAVEKLLNYIGHCAFFLGFRGSGQLQENKESKVLSIHLQILFGCHKSSDTLFFEDFNKSSTDQNQTGPDYNSIRMLSWSHGLKCICWHELICSLKRHVNRKHEEQSQNKDVVVTGANTAALLQTGILWDLKKLF